MQKKLLHHHRRESEKECLSLSVCNFEKVIDSIVAVINLIEEKSYCRNENSSKLAGGAETKHHFSARV